MTVNNEPIIVTQTLNVSVKNGWTYFIKQHLGELARRINIILVSNSTLK